MYKNKKVFIPLKLRINKIDEIIQDEAFKIIDLFDDAECEEEMKKLHTAAVHVGNIRKRFKELEKEYVDKFLKETA